MQNDRWEQFMLWLFFSINIENFKGKFTYARKNYAIITFVK